MTSRVRSPPTSPYRMVRVVDAGGPSRGRVITRRTRLAVLVVALVVLVVLTAAVWPAKVEDLSGERVFEGEVWGDLTMDGEIWSEHESEFDHVVLIYWGPSGGEGLHVRVSNVSSVLLVDLDADTNVSIPCHDGTFEIMTENGSVNVYMSDLEFRCDYLFYQGVFPGDKTEYFPRYSVSSVEGRGYLTNGRAVEWYQHEGFELDRCLVSVDGVGYPGKDVLHIPDGETAYIEVEGTVEPPGTIRAPRGHGPHVNGSLEIENFLLKRGERTMMLDRISFVGEDVVIQTTRTSQYGTGGPFAWFDQWTIEVTAPEDATIVVERAPDTPWWVMAVLIFLITALSMAIVGTVPLRWSGDTG